jgi:hypothetical protein
MSLYYLQESEDRKRDFPQGAWVRRILLWSGLLLLIASSILQAAGFFWEMERTLIHLLPKNRLPESSKTILLQAERGENGFKALDVAMALRGLAKLHPSQIVIAGPLSPDEQSRPLLNDLLTRLSDDNISVIQPQVASPDTQYRPIPLCSYNPPKWMGLSSQWQILPGSLSNKGWGCFLPAAAESEGNDLPLLAVTKYGEVIPSLWWPGWIFTSGKSPAMNGPIWLFAGRLLILPNHSTLFLDGSGKALPLPGEQARMELLDDFLLQMEQKERGTLSPGFDELWIHSTVVLGSSDDRERVALFSALAEKISWAHLPFLWQWTEAAMLAILVLVLHQRRISLRIVVALMILLLTISATILCARHALLVPFLPPLVAGFLLCCQRDRELLISF